MPLTQQQQQAIDQAVEQGVTLAIGHLQGLPGLAAKLAAAQALPALEARLRAAAEQLLAATPADMPAAETIGLQIAHALVGSLGFSPVIAGAAQLAVDLVPAIASHVEDWLSAATAPGPVTKLSNDIIVPDTSAPPADRPQRPNP